MESTSIVLKPFSQAYDFLKDLTGRKCDISSLNLPILPKETIPFSSVFTGQMQWVSDLLTEGMSYIVTYNVYLTTLSSEYVLEWFVEQLTFLI